MNRNNDDCALHHKVCTLITSLSCIYEIVCSHMIMLVAKANWSFP